MRILMLTPYYDPHIGGVEKHVKKISEELVRQGNQVSIITWKHSPDLPEAESLNGISLLRIPEQGRKKIWPWIWRNRELIRSASVVHCHDYATFYYWYLPYRFLYFWKPVFVTFHGYEKYPPSRRTIRIRRLVEKLSTACLCVGKFISKWYGTRCDKLLWGGVGDSPKEIVEEKEESAVFVGRLERDTGIENYLEALRIVKRKEGESLRLYVCGDGSLRNSISETAQNHKLDVVLCGTVDHPSEYLRRCRYAFVSGYLAILEAMISNALVFSIYDNPLKEDYLKLMPESDRIMVVCSSPEELADRFSETRRNPQLQREIVSRAHQFAENMSWVNVTQEYLELYARMMNGN